MPQRHAKTKICSICFSAWILAHNPAVKIMIVTYSKDLAESISRSIRDILQSSWFKEVFRTRVAKGHAKSSNFATTAGGEVYATSFDGSITGFGGDVIIIDDPHDVSDVENPKLLQRTIDKFHSMVVRRLNNRKRGRIMVIGHRVHEEDLSADLLESGGWTHLALPIIAPKDQSYKTAYGCWNRRKGELLRPDADDIDDIERLPGRLVNPPFELLYQQDVEAQSLPALTAEHFPSYDEDAIRNLPHFLSVDPGTDEGAERSHSVVQVWASNGHDQFLVKQVRKRCDFDALLKHVTRLARDYTGAPILIEKTANGPALLSKLSKRHRARAVAIVPRDSKTTRFRRHYDKYLAGRIRIQNDASFRDKFIEEVTSFPHGRHDDQVDAMTQFLDYLAKRDDIDFGRSNITRGGICAGAFNSQYDPRYTFAPPWSQDPKAPGVIVVANNSSPRPPGWPQPQDPKAPGIIAGANPAHYPFPRLLVRGRW